MDDWDELIDNVLFTYRSSRQVSTKCTLMYGQEARLLIDLVHVVEKDEEISSEQEFDEKVKCMLELRAKVHSYALTNITKAQEQQEKQFDAKHNTANTKLKAGVKVHVLVKDMKNAERKGGKLNKLLPGE